jgi:hypothetical protein
LGSCSKENAWLCQSSLQPAKVQEWLEERGFRVSEQDARRIVLVSENVEAFLAIKEAELADVILTFTLTRDSPAQWERWQALVDQLCTGWSLRLYDPKRDSLVNAGDLLPILADTQAWKNFERQFNWPQTH